MNALLRLLAWLLAVVLVALPVVAVVNGWIGAERWPLRTLRVSGEMQRVDPQQLRQVGLLTQQAAGDMGSQEISPARSGHDQLLPSWEGADQVQYKTFVDEILTTGDTLVSRLETVGLLLLTAESTYAEAQARETESFNRISGVLNG